VTEGLPELAVVTVRDRGARSGSDPLGDEVPTGTCVVCRATGEDLYGDPAFEGWVCPLTEDDEPERDAVSEGCCLYWKTERAKWRRDEEHR
jgi:hypothetical protein